MFIAILTLLSALSISGVAIFYSVIGLATIFPGAFVPVVIMGGVLEVGKLITASWLYRNWKFTPFMLKTYLTTAHFKTITGIQMIGNSAGNVIAGTTTGAADVISKATCRLHSMDIVSGGTAGVVNFHNGITDGVPGTILFKHRTLGTDNTAPGHITFGGDGILFDKGMYVTYTIGHIDMMNFFFN